MQCRTRAKWPSRMLIFSLALMWLTILPGCSLFGTRAILVQPGTACKTLTPINTTLLAPDKDGNLVEAKALIPAGATVVVPAVQIKHADPLPSPDKAVLDQYIKK